MMRLVALLALVALCAVARADDVEVYDPYWAVVFPTPPASLNLNDPASRDANLYGNPTWTDLSKDEAFMDAVPHVSHVSKKTTTTSRAPVPDINGGCRAPSGVLNADGSITYCSASVSTCTGCGGSDCPDIRPCIACAGRDLHFVAGTSISPYEAPTPNFISESYPLSPSCPEDLLTTPTFGHVQAIQAHFPITLTMRAVAPYAGDQLDRSYIINDPCVANYGIMRIQQILENGNDAPTRNVTKANGDVYCEIWNSAGFLGAIGLETVNAPFGFPVTCYNKAIVPFSFHALGYPDPYSVGGSFIVNKACVRGLLDAYVAAYSTCVL